MRESVPNVMSDFMMRSAYLVFNFDKINTKICYIPNNTKKKKKKKKKKKT